MTRHILAQAQSRLRSERTIAARRALERIAQTHPGLVCECARPTVEDGRYVNPPLCRYHTILEAYEDTERDAIDTSDWEPEGPDEPDYDYDDGGDDPGDDE